MPKKATNQKGKTSSWTLAGTFGTFKEADSKRKRIGENTSVQTKVRRRHSKNSFTVHYRNKPPAEETKSKKK